MRKIEIQLEDETFAPGSTVEGQVLVTCDDDFKCERLFVSLYGEEVARVVIHVGKVTIVHEDKREHVNDIKDFDDCSMIPVGETRYDFSFTLPPDIPGSYKGTFGWIKYTLEAKAEISRARDLKSKLDLSLRCKQVIESIPEPKSDTLESDGITLLKVETDKDHFSLGDNLDFRFFVDRETSFRGVRAEVIRLEQVEPKGYETESKKELAEIYFQEDELRRDSWVEATIQTDSNWKESFTSALIEHHHFLKVTLDIALRRDKVIEIPIVLVRKKNEKSDFDF
ncbi:MAG: sporulation protein [Candidatus Thorarchaeota archaeon]|nr:sporulation protein [Candidatus Thorarchaeota archaeon]